MGIETPQVIPPNTVLIWEDIYDNVGNAYNSSSGKFVAPLSGVYQFTITVMSPDIGGYVYLNLVVDGMKRCSALAGEEVSAG